MYTYFVEKSNYVISIQFSLDLVQIYVILLYFVCVVFLNFYLQVYTYILTSDPASLEYLKNSFVSILDTLNILIFHANLSNTANSCKLYDVYQEVYRLPKRRNFDKQNTPRLQFAEQIKYSSIYDRSSVFNAYLFRARNFPSQKVQENFDQVFVFS